MPYPRYQRARSFKFSNYINGNLPLASTSITSVAGPLLDVTLDAQPSDVLLVSLCAKVQNQSNGIYFNAAPMVSGAPTGGIHGGPLNNFTQVPTWFVSAGVFGIVSGSWMYQVKAGDLVGGLVTLRPYYTTDAASPARVVEAITAVPLQFSAMNLGPVDPN